MNKFMIITAKDNVDSNIISKHIAAIWNDNIGQVYFLVLFSYQPFWI
jgi:hypothetical protein